MRVDIVSIFPEVFEPYMSSSMMGRARSCGQLEFYTHDLRAWTHDRHRTVDDEPYGGGQGMLMRCEPLFEAHDYISQNASSNPWTIFFSPAGKPFKQADAQALAAKEHLVMFCGRYEGVDERAYTLADEVLSLGDYVITGGELAALTVTDAVVRLLPGVLGDEQSALDESFEGGLLEHEQYTRPAEYRNMCVPDILLSGNHGKIEQWRRENRIVRTLTWRPDLLDTATLSEKERAFLDEYRAKHIKTSE